MSYLYPNAATSALAASIGPSDTTLEVMSAAGFPTSGDFPLLIDDELLLVTSVSGTTFTVTRAVEPWNGVQTAVGHGLGSLVSSPLTNASLLAIVGGTNPIGAASGDLAGAYPGPTVAAIQGESWDPTAPTSGQVPQWSGTAWTPTTISSAPSGPAGGDLAGSYPNPGLVATGPGAGSFTNANISIDAEGRVTAAASGSSGGPPTGPAGGDLAGSYPNPTVAQIQGQAWDATAPTTGFVPQWSGTAWVAVTVPAAPPNGAAGGDLAGSYPNPTVAQLQGLPWTGGTPANGQIPQWSSTAWVFVNPPGASIGSAVAGSSTGSILFVDNLSDLTEDPGFGFGYDPTGSTGPQSTVASLYIGGNLTGSQVPSIYLFDPAFGTWRAITLNASGWFEFTADATIPQLTLTVNGGLLLTGQTSGAAGFLGTLATAPIAGPPTFWCPIQVNGGFGYFPVWVP
jgi:hypothetical protein